MLPPFVQWLIIANFVAFLAENLLGDPLIEWFALWPGDWGALASAPWTLVTYSFLHAGVTHLLFNMFALWMFGSDLERVWGAKRLALGYFGGVVIGALAQVFVVAAFGGRNVPVVGASAGVFAMLAGYAIVFPNRIVMLLIPPIPLPARVFVLLYGALELALGVTGTATGVAHFAHLGGMAGGWIAYRFGGRLSGRWRGRR
ncbi:MAG: rhomboid family intramembrane serine protease [Burkholderiaceae bacterium]|nr:rhomboid family intramembrane serine protease [Burkholderiaceae bacterium]